MTPAETQALADAVAAAINNTAAKLIARYDPQIEQLKARVLELEGATAAAEPVRA